MKNPNYKRSCINDEEEKAKGKTQRLLKKPKIAPVGGAPVPPKKRFEPFGRPTKYDPSFCQKLIEHMAQGLGFESFAAGLDCSSAVLYDWVKRHPDFLEAKKIGTAKALAFFECAGVDGMMGRIPNFSVGAFAFMMKNKFGWTDRTESNSVHTVKPLVIEKLSGEQLLLTSEKIEAPEDDEPQL